MINNFIKWLYSTPSKWSDTRNIDIANEIFELFMEWMKSIEDLHLIIPEKDLLIHFYNLIYNLGINKSIDYNVKDDQYFFLKYHEDFVDLFIKIKEIYSSNLFNNNNITADNFLQFFNNYIEKSDEIYEDDDIDYYLDYDECLF
tara:strand:- start:465 stop:896 length:432 start_codon:yes stop_codon:yes gene_type:complete